MVAVCLALLMIASPIWPLGENPSYGDPFLIVNVATNELAYINDGSLQEILPVASGKEGDRTPTGFFSVVVKAKNPYYRKLDIQGGDVHNPLGTRWIGFDASGTDGRIYGIHGTNRPDSIGSHVTAGCIRLPNEVVEKLYEDIPLGTKLYITDEVDASFEDLAKKAGAM
jgi:lipoprotein-anchoring transpeptidase ErfK/SrfK